MRSGSLVRLAEKPCWLAVSGLCILQIQIILLNWYYLGSLLVESLFGSG